MDILMYKSVVALLSIEYKGRQHRQASGLYVGSRVRRTLASLDPLLHGLVEAFLQVD